MGNIRLGGWGSQYNVFCRTNKSAHSSECIGFLEYPVAVKLQSGGEAAIRGTATSHRPPLLVRGACRPEAFYPFTLWRRFPSQSACGLAFKILRRERKASAACAKCPSLPLSYFLLVTTFYIFQVFPWYGMTFRRAYVLVLSLAPRTFHTIDTPFRSLLDPF